jgi:hypothetical protein
MSDSIYAHTVTETPSGVFAIGRVSGKRLKGPESGGYCVFTKAHSFGGKVIRKMSTTQWDYLERDISHDEACEVINGLAGKVVFKSIPIRKGAA